MQSVNLINNIESIDGQPYIIVSNNIIIEVSQPFADMIEYSIDELINNNISEILNALKVGPKINLKNIDKNINYFLFTKYLEVRFVDIEVIQKIDKQIYVFREKLNSRFEYNNHFLERFITENKTGIGVFTASDFTLIRANESYLNNFPEPYDTKKGFYGKSLGDVMPYFRGSSIEKAWTDAVIYNKSVSYKEQQGLLPINRNRYWDYTIIPVSINKQVEYIVVMLDEVTEHVANREHIRKQSEMIEQRNKQLEAIVESIDDILLILDNQGNVHKQSSININFYDKLTNNINKFFDFNNNPLPVEDIPCHKVLEKGKKVKNFKMKIVENEREKYTIINGTPIFNSNGDVELGIFAILDITDLMKKKRQIKKQKELLENIISNTSNGIFIYNKEGKQLAMNEIAKKLVCSANSLNTLEDIYSVAEYFYEDERIVPKEEMPTYRALRGEIVDGEKMVVKQPHRELVLEFKSSPIYDNDGNIDMIITSNHNITELVNQNKIIKQQKELLESIIENVSDAIIVYDKDKNVLLQNEASKKFIYQPENFKTLGDRLYMTRCLDFDGNEISTYDLPAYKSFKGEKITNFMVTFQRPDKTLHCRTSSSPIYDEYGNINNVVVCMHDITDIIKQEEQIKEQKEQLEAIINNMQEPILVFDKDEKYIIKNNVAIELLETIVETIEDSVKAKRFFNMNGSEITYEKTPAYYARHGKTVKGKIIYFEANGRKEYLIMNAVPIMDSKGNFLYGILSGRNITEFMESQQNLKLAQEQLLKVEHEKNETLQKALEMKDEFLSLISHEFKTPINVISTAIQGLNYIYGNELSDKVKQYLGIIRQNTFRQLRLVNNLLDITRANAGRIKINKKNIDIVLLTKAVTESVYGYAAQKGVKVSLASSFKKKVIGIDDEKYERIILNLLSNAIKFTSEGNSISVTLRSIKDSICIEVKDDGIGIPSDKLDIIFDRFGQVDSSLSRQAEGTGIGLSLVKMFVKALGGSISVKSKVGKGSTFTVMLPNKRIVEEEVEIKTIDLMDNHLVEVINVEFSDIYL
jgi:PAS domain S-box-containing protein